MENKGGFVARGYGRASTDRQVMSTEVQQSVAFAAFEAFVKSRPKWRDAVWGGFFPDGAEFHTCRETKLRERHYGSLILAASQPGDFIIAANFDRIFANPVDVCESLELCRQREIGIVVLDTDIDTSTIFGEMVFTILAAIKKMEVREIRRRTKESIAYRQRIGRPATYPLIGWKHKTVRIPGVQSIQRYLVPDERARRYARQLFDIMTRGEYSHRQAFQYCNSEGFKQINGTPWTIHTFIKWMRAVRNDFVLPNGNHEACPIPADAVPVLVETISEGD